MRFRATTMVARYSGSGAPVVVVHADGHEEYVVGNKPRDRFALSLGLVALAAFVAGTLRRVRV
jgi:hypothetical protein